MKMPERFCEADERGFLGYTEWGFLSTTSNKPTAIEYSGASKGKPLPTVLVTVTGAIDRGAYIAELSQYPQQEEYLWAPCSFLEPSGEAVVEAVGDSGDGGVVTVVPVRAAFTDTDASYQ